MSALILFQLLFLALILVVSAALMVVYASMFWALFRDAPFVPSPVVVAESMMDLARVKPGETVIDLGSGNGNILFAAAGRGARAIGYELSRFLGLLTLARRWLFYPRLKVEVRRRDLFAADLRGADVVTCYLYGNTMRSLRYKFEKELAPGARVVSSAFEVPGWRPVEVIHSHRRPVYLYQFGKT